MISESRFAADLHYGSGEWSVDDVKQLLSRWNVLRSGAEKGSCWQVEGLAEWTNLVKALRQTVSNSESLQFNKRMRTFQRHCPTTMKRCVNPDSQILSRAFSISSTPVSVADELFDHFSDTCQDYRRVLPWQTETRDLTTGLWKYKSISNMHTLKDFKIRAPHTLQISLLYQKKQWECFPRIIYLWRSTTISTLATT